ncbi:glutathione S-transferase [Sphingomonas sp. F9_3S_D5_B_2]
MRPTITAFANSPDGGRGLARDMRVRWALEEVGQEYDVQLVPWEDFKKPAHRAKQPFAQIPTFEQGSLVLFETGAIVLHIAETHEGLLSRDPDARARAITWMFAAVSTIEPPVIDFEVNAYFEQDEPWGPVRRVAVQTRLRTRLADLATALGESEWIDGPFSAGDLMLVEVLLRVENELAAFPNLLRYVDRARARPAFQRAFAAQKAVADAAIGPAPLNITQSGRA